MHPDHLVIEAPSDVESVSLRVLVIEDDAFIRNVEHEFLTATADANAFLDLDITLVNSGDEALLVCQEGQGFDLVLLDYCMPGQTGASVLPAIRAALGSLSVIVMVSSLTQEPLLKRCLELGADTYRLKPFGLEVVRDLLVYTMGKLNFLTKRARTRRPRSPVTDATEPPTFRMLVASEGCCLAQGRRGPAYLGLMPSGGEPVAIKVISRDTVSLHPPPVHPNLNRILRRVEEGELNFEMRALCDGGVSATPRSHTRATTPKA